MTVVMASIIEQTTTAEATMTTTKVLTDNSKTTTTIIQNIVDVSDQELEAIQSMISQVDSTRSTTQVIVVIAKRESATALTENLQLAFPTLSFHTSSGGSSLRDELKELVATTPQVVIGTPGRLVDLLKRGTITVEDVRSTFIVNEAHMKSKKGGFADQLKSFDDIVTGKEVIAPKVKKSKEADTKPKQAKSDTTTSSTDDAPLIPAVSSSTRVPSPPPRKVPESDLEAIQALLNQVDITERSTQMLILVARRDIASELENSLQSEYPYIRFHTSIGGGSIKEEVHDLQSKPHVIIGTPGRVMDLLRRKAIETHALQHTWVVNIDLKEQGGMGKDIETILQHVGSH